MAAARAYLHPVSRTLAAWFFVAILSGLPIVRAQGGESSDDPVSSALAAYDVGDYANARRWFEIAHSRAPSARTLRGLGITAFALGDFGMALDQLEAALEHPTRPLTDELRAGVEELMVRARSRLARIDLASAPDAVLLLLVDGMQVELDDERGRYVQPGIHRIEVRIGSETFLEVVEELGMGETFSPESFADDRSTSSAATPGASSGIDHSGLAESAEPELPPDELGARPTSARNSPRWRRLGRSSGVLVGALLTSSGILYGIGYRRHLSVRYRCDPGCTAERVGELYDDEHIDPLRRSAGVLLGVGLAAAVLIPLSFGMAGRELRAVASAGPTHADVGFEWRF